MIPTIPRRGGCDACSAVRVIIRYDDLKLHSVRVRHEQGCPALAARRNPSNTQKETP